MNCLVDIILSMAWMKLHSSVLRTFFVYTLTLSMPIFKKFSLPSKSLKYFTNRVGINMGSCVKWHHSFQWKKYFYMKYATLWPLYISSGHSGQNIIWNLLESIINAWCSAWWRNIVLANNIISLRKSSSNSQLISTAASLKGKQCWYNIRNTDCTKI